MPFCVPDLTRNHVTKSVHENPVSGLMGACPLFSLELALKLHADWREHFAAEEKRLAEERAAAEQEKTAPPAQAQGRSLCGAIVIGGLEFCRRTAARLGLEIEPEEIEPGLFGLFRRHRRHA